MLMDVKNWTSYFFKLLKISCKVKNMSNQYYKDCSEMKTAQSIFVIKGLILTCFISVRRNVKCIATMSKLNK